MSNQNLIYHNIEKTGGKVKVCNENYAKYIKQPSIIFSYINF